MEISKKTSESIIKLNAAMILIDGKIEDQEIQQATHFLNKGFKLNTTVEQLKSMLKNKIDVDKEIEIIINAKPTKDEKIAIVNSLVMIAVSDSEYHAKESELVFKVAKKLNVDMDDKEVERLTNVQDQLSKVRSMIEDSEKSVNKFNTTLNSISKNNPKEAENIKNLKEKMNSITSTTSSHIGKALTDAMQNGEITSKDMFAYIDMLKKMPPDFSILVGSMARHAPEKFIETVKGVGGEDEPIEKNAWLSNLIGIGVIGLILYFIFK